MSLDVTAFVATTKIVIYVLTLPLHIPFHGVANSISSLYFS